MKKVSVISNSKGQNDDVLITFQGKTEAQKNGPFSVPAKQITFYMWSDSKLKEEMEFEFEVIKRDGAKMTRIELLDTKSGAYLECDVIYKTMEVEATESEEAKSITLKYLDIVGIGKKENIE